MLFPETPNNSFSLIVTCAKGSINVSATSPTESLTVVGPRIGKIK